MKYEKSFQKEFQGLQDRIIKAQREMGLSPNTPTTEEVMKAHEDEYLKCAEAFPKLKTHSWEVWAYYPQRGVVKVSVKCTECGGFGYSDVYKDYPYPSGLCPYFYFNHMNLTLNCVSFYADVPGCKEMIMKKALE